VIWYSSAPGVGHLQDRKMSEICRVFTYQTYVTAISLCLFLFIGSE
jgi:hypothetical protein